MSPVKVSTVHTWKINNWASALQCIKTGEKASKSDIFFSPTFEVKTCTGAVSTWRIKASPVTQASSRQCLCWRDQKCGFLFLSLEMQNGEKLTNGLYQLKAKKKCCFGRLTEVTRTPWLDLQSTHLGLPLDETCFSSKDIIIQATIEDRVEMSN